MSRPAWRRALLLFLTAWLFAAEARALPAVFQGDPVDALGRPYALLPGVPLVLPGPDGRFDDAGGGDDVIDPGTVGDVDVVLRTGNAYTPGSGTIPPTSASAAMAPVVIAGGSTLQPGAGQATFQLIVSDGATSAPAGNPLTASDLDGRGALIFAYADLDGDGFLGATSADPAGSADDAIELQEALTPVGRRLGIVTSGLAAGALAVSRGLPASTGGLGVVVVGGAITGAASPLFLDGTWVATLLPCMWPVDATHVVGDEPGPPDPFGLVDVEIEREDFFCPAPDHPLIGTPYAIPLDGSSVTTDLLRAESGAASAVGLARPVSAAGWVATPLAQLTPLVSSLGARTVVEPVSALTLADDGPGGMQAQLVAFPADRLGNQADVPFGGSTLTLEVTPELRIVAPDTDADPRREAIAFATTGYATITLDDAGGESASSGFVTARLDGVPASALRVTFGGAPSEAPLAGAKARLRRAKTAGTDGLSLTAAFDASGAPPFATSDLELRVLDGDKTVLARTIPAGALLANGAGTAFRHRDPAQVAAMRITTLALRPRAGTSIYTLRLMVNGLDLSDVDPDVGQLTVTIGVGSRSFTGDLDCTPNASGSTTACVR